MTSVSWWAVLAAMAAAVMFGMAVEEAAGATTTIEGVDIEWEVQDSKGNTYFWSMPVTTYENQIVESRYHVRDKMNLDLDGETISLVSLDGFVRESFRKVIDDVYDNSYSNSDFIWEVWYIVSQLTVYDEDIHEYSEGRYALETLSRGGGDCEDLVILVADMLMSSKHTDDWTIQYVVMDIDNPTDPQEINHVILFVNDGEYNHFVEATGPPSWDYFNTVYGWYLDIVPYTDELDFSGQDLRWMDLRQRDLSGADLSGADLEGADLAFSDLRYADLSGADLTLANLYGAYLEGADLTNAILANTTLVGAYMGEADMSWAYLYGAEMQRSSVYDADLSNAWLSQANLRGAIMYGADLSDAILLDANMYGADLSYADMSGADLSYADMSGASLYGANMRNAVLEHSTLWGADMTSADLRGAYLVGASLHGADLYDANLRGAAVDSISLVGAQNADCSQPSGGTC